MTHELVRSIQDKICLFLKLDYLKFWALSGAHEELRSWCNWLIRITWKILLKWCMHLQLCQCHISISRLHSSAFYFKWNICHCLTFVLLLFHWPPYGPLIDIINVTTTEFRSTERHSVAVCLRAPDSDLSLSLLWLTILEQGVKYTNSLTILVILPCQNS